MKQMPDRVEKPWGFELIWAHTSQYVGKLLHVNAGEALSLQYHEVKDETIFLFSGEMNFWAGPSVEALERVPLAPGEAFRVKPQRSEGQRHHAPLLRGRGRELVGAKYVGGGHHDLEGQYRGRGADEDA